jgi:hypothetical protein
MADRADIFRSPGPDYRQQSGAPMLPSPLHARADIEQCRSEALGGNI